MGKELKSVFLEAGFQNIRATASFDHFGSEEDAAFLHGFVLDWFFSPNVVAAATAYGLATQEQFDNWRAALDQLEGPPRSVRRVSPSARRWREKG